MTVQSRHGHGCNPNVSSKIVASRPGGGRANSACALPPKRGRPKLSHLFGRLFCYMGTACEMPPRTPDTPA
eukprot:8884266-Lingulodinium_polyedra.AAC.1